MCNTFNYFRGEQFWEVRKPLIIKVNLYSTDPNHSNLQLLITCLFNKQWNINIISPWRELAMTNIYLKAMVDELMLRRPNNHAIPSRGRTTAEALTPALTFSNCVLFWMCRVPIIWRITRINTTIFIWVKKKKEKLYPLKMNSVWEVTILTQHLPTSLWFLHFVFWDCTKLKRERRGGGGITSTCTSF